MSQRLTQEYLKDHMTEATESQSLENALYNFFAEQAQSQLGSESDERDEIQLSIPVTLRPVENAAPEENCVEVSVGPVSWHRTFRGKYPGPDDKWPGA